MEFELANLFNYVSQAWENFSDSAVYDLTKAALLIGSGYFGKKYLDYRKDKQETKAIREEDYKSVTASVIQLAYIDTHQNIDETKFNYILQWQTRLGRIDITAPFDDKIKTKIAEYLDLAIAECTHENPVVFNHLKKVVPTDDYPKVRDAIRNYWRIHFSFEIGKASEYPIFAELDLDIGYEPVKRPFVPTLVYDPDSTVKELRVLWLSEKQVDNAPYVNKRHVVVERPNALTIDVKPESDSVDLQWVELFNNTIFQLRENKDAVDLCRIGILTGESKKIPKLVV